MGFPCQQEKIGKFDTKEKLKKKLDMVQDLGDIEIATRLIEKIKEKDDIDANYEKLNCEIVAIETDVIYS